MLNFSGTGKMVLGHSDRDKATESYTGTLWFTVLFLPIFPIKSMRIQKTDPDPNHPKIVHFKQVGEVPLHLKQVMRTYLISYTIAFLIGITIRYYALQIMNAF